MTQSTDINGILNDAIAREEEAYRFYGELANRVSDAAVKETFSRLADDELGHRNFLRSCIADPRLLNKLPVPTDYKVAEATEQPPLSLDMKPASAMALAMKKEQEAAEFYKRLAQAATDTSYREAFLGLAHMELGHKVRIEELFVNMGYPEVF